MKLAASNPEFYFAFFYVLSFLVSFALVLIFSYRLKIPLWSVLLMLTIVSLFTIVGSRLSTIPVSEWGQIISTGKFEGYQGRFAVGGLLFGLGGLVLSLKILQLGKPVIDLYAWITPIGFGIQKIGCFFNGCCYGKPSALPWSIQYPSGTSAHFHQWISGIIDKNAAYSLSLHPVQLYEVICLFTIALIVWKSQKFWKKTGSILMFSLCLFFAFRFCIEFLRDPASSSFRTTPVLSISTLQWFFLATAIFCAFILLLYERRKRPLIQNFRKNEPSLKKSILYVLSVSIVIYIFRGLFTPFELLSLNMKFIPAIFLTAFYVYKSLKTVRFKLATTTFFVLPVFFITHTLLPDSTKADSIKDFYENKVKSYKRVDIGTSFGNFNNALGYDPHEGQCGTSYTYEDYKYVYRIAGAGYSAIKNKGNYTITSGINLYGGIIKENNLTRQWETTDFLVGVNPYFKYDRNWVGAGAGVHLGNIRWVPGSPINETVFDRGTRFSPLMPEVYLRVGRRDIVDLKYTYGFGFPTSLPVLLHEFSLGSGFGNKTDFSLRFGAAVSEYNTFTFFSVEGPVTKNVGVTFKYNFGNGVDYSGTNEAVNRVGRILFGVNYRFGFEK